MSRHAQLPPRCPLQKKHSIPPAIGAASSPSCNDVELRPNAVHNKSTPQSTMLDEQPSWLNDLLTVSDSSSSRIIHRRAASDPLTLSEPDNDKESLDTSQPNEELVSSCAYGPNSPRSKNKADFPENEIVSAFSEYVMQNPMQHAAGCVAGGIPQLHLFGDDTASAGAINNEGKPMKRHPGQRSRVRKLQYIAELERAVDALQNLGSELTVSVASMLQQQVLLSLENNTLKQQLLRKQQEKFIVEGEYQYLKKELERLRTGLVFSSNRRLHARPRSAANLTHPADIWEMIDMAKLNLN